MLGIYSIVPLSVSASYRFIFVSLCCLSMNVFALWRGANCYATLFPPYSMRECVGSQLLRRRRYERVRLWFHFSQRFRISAHWVSALCRPIGFVIKCLWRFGGRMSRCLRRSPDYHFRVGLYRRASTLTKLFLLPLDSLPFSAYFHDRYGLSLKVGIFTDLTDFVVVNGVRSD